LTEDLRQFVEARYGDLLRTAFLLTGSSTAAEDLVQDALARALRHWDEIDEPMAYLHRMMVNKRTNIWQRITSRELLAGTLPEELHRSAVAPDAAARVAEREDLLAALAGLSPRTRAVIVLRYWLDMSEADVASMLGCARGTVKSQAARGLLRLRDVLEPHDPTDSPATPARNG
jgi:RNA polymerase sigma-70 factor (sigma-E family)